MVLRFDDPDWFGIRQVVETDGVTAWLTMAVEGRRREDDHGDLARPVGVVDVELVLVRADPEELYWLRMGRVDALRFRDRAG